MKSLCRTCGETFGGLRGFEWHCVGDFNNKPPHYGRRCLAPWEMVKIGLVKSDKGVWIRAFSSTEAAGEADEAGDYPLAGTALPTPLIVRGERPSRMDEKWTLEQIQETENGNQ